MHCFLPSANSGTLTWNYECTNVSWWLESRKTVLICSEWLHIYIFRLRMWQGSWCWSSWNYTYTSRLRLDTLCIRHVIPYQHCTNYNLQGLFRYCFILHYARNLSVLIKQQQKRQSQPSLVKILKVLAVHFEINTTSFNSRYSRRTCVSQYKNTNDAVNLSLF